MFRGHISFSFFIVVFSLSGCCFVFDVFCFVGFFLFSSCRPRQLLVLLGLQLLLPGLVQVNQSLVVEDKENEVQRVRGDADDAEVLQDKVEDVAQVERAHHRQDGCRHEDEGGHCTHSHS